jgi:Ca-activated chloride channel homolog
MSLLFPLGMAALGALVPLVALYLLKQKRIEQKVPTNFLWARAVEDLRASSLFQRLRATLLLVLQALAVALCALAAAGATLSLRLGDVPRHVVLLVDRSASMKTRDEDGRARIDVAKEIARREIEALSGADEMMVVAFDARAEVAAAFTSDRSRLVAVVDGLAARDLPTRAADALMLAVSFAQASKGFDTEIHVLSDGVVADELPSVPCPVTYVRIGRAGENQGVSSLQVSRAPGEAAQLFVHVENAAKRAVDRTLSLRRGDQVLAARSVALPAEGGVTVYFELPEAPGSDAQASTVRLEGKDDLPDDDVASFVLRPVVPRVGLLVAAEPAIWLDPRKLERLHPGLALATATPEEAASAFAAGDATIDFVCYAGVEPKELPPVAAQMYVDAVPPGAGLVRGPTQSYPIVIDWDRTHPTTSRCQFDDLLVAESTKLGGVERSRVLIDSTGGPLALLTPVPGREVVVLAFSPGKSNFPLKLSWPLFLANTLDFLLSKTERAGEEPVARTGTTISVAAKSAVHVTRPSGETIVVEPDAKGRATYAATDEAGVWRVQVGDAPTELRAYAALDAAEIHVAPREQLVVGGEKLGAVDRPTRRDVLLRDPLLLAALGILVLEWAIWCGRR